MQARQEPDEALPNLIDTLNDSDDEVVAQSIATVDKMSSKLVKFQNAVASSEAMISAIVAVANKSADLLCGDPAQPPPPPPQDAEAEARRKRATHNAIAATNILRNLTSNKDRGAAECGRHVAVRAGAVRPLTLFLGCALQERRVSRQSNMPSISLPRPFPNVIYLSGSKGGYWIFWDHFTTT